MNDDLPTADEVFGAPSSQVPQMDAPQGRLPTADEVFGGAPKAATAQTAVKERPAGRQAAISSGLSVPPPPITPTMGQLGAGQPSGNIGNAFLQQQYPSLDMRETAPVDDSVPFPDADKPIEQKKEPLKGNVLTEIRNDSYKIPIVGPALEAIGHGLNELGHVPGEFMGNKAKGVPPQGLKSIGAGIMGTEAGLEDNAQALLALLNRVSSPLTPQDQLIMAPKGKTLGQEIADQASQAFPGAPHALQTGRNLGNLILPIKGINATEGAMIGQLMQNPVLKRIGQLLINNPRLLGAVEGGAVNTGLQAGSNVAQHQPIQKDMGQSGAIGTVLGALLHGGKTAEPPEAAAPQGQSMWHQPITPESHRMGTSKGQVPPEEPIDVEEVQEPPRRISETKGVSQTAPPPDHPQIGYDKRVQNPYGAPVYPSGKPYYPTGMSQPHPTTEARQRRVGQILQAGEPGAGAEPKGPQKLTEVKKPVSKAKPPVLQKQEPKMAPRTEPQLKGRVEKIEVPEESQPGPPDNPPLQAKAEPPTPGKAKKIYDKLGIQPPVEEENIHEAKRRVPVLDLKEKGPSGRYDQPLDLSHNKPRRVKWNRNNKIYAGIPHPKSAEHGQLGGELDRGIDKDAAAMLAMENGTHEAGRADAAEEGRMTDKQKHAQKREEEEVAKGNARKAQADMVAKTSKKISDLESGLVYNDPLWIGPTLKGLKFVGKHGVEASRIFHENLPEEAAAFLKVENTLDRIGSGADKVGDNIRKQLVRNIGLEAHHTRGLDMDGTFGHEAREAIRHETPDEIMDEEMHPDWTQEQREAIATKKAIRARSKELIGEVLERHGDDIDPEYAKALKEYSSEQFGHSGDAPKGIEKVLNGLSGNLYDSFFRNNPAFAALIHTHVPTMGSAVTGVRNIAAAYHKLTTDPKMRDFYKETQGMVKDQYKEERELQRAEDSKKALPWRRKLTELTKPRGIFKKDIPMTEINNSLIHYAGMLQEARKIYKGRGEAEAALDKLRDGTLSDDEAIELHVAGAEALIEATGGGTYGMNRSYLQSSPLFRQFAQLSGYKNNVARFLSKQGRRWAKAMADNDHEAIKDSSGKIFTLLATTTLMGGHAIVPKELEEPLAKMLGPKTLYELEAALDKVNLPKQLLHQDLSDHMQFSMLNYGENAALNGFGTLLRDIKHVLAQDSDKTPYEQYTDILGHALMMSSLSAPGGVGVSTWMKAKQGLSAMEKGQKKLNIYSRSLFSPSVYPEERTTMSYDGTDILRALLAPGAESRVSNEQHRVEFDKFAKKYPEKEPMPDMEEDYPVKDEGIPAK